MREIERGQVRVLGRYLPPGLLLGLIVLASVILSSSILDAGHNWGDDFAAYIGQAQALVTGRVDEFVHRNAFTMGQSSFRFGPVTVPWGLPLLLAPVYALFGLDMLAFKLLITACYAAFLVVLFNLARTRLTIAESLLLTAFLAFNLHFLRAQNEIFADIPFLLWSTLALWLMEKHSGLDSGSQSSSAAGILIGLCIFLSVITRLNGLLLFVPLEVAYAARIAGAHAARRPILPILRAAVIPHAVFAALFALQTWALPSVVGGPLQPGLEIFSARMVLHHAAYYFQLPGDIFRDAGIGGFATYAVMLIFFVMRVIAAHRGDAPLLLYMLATFLFYSFFPPIQGPRYMYPILPVFFLFAFDGMKSVAARIGRSRQAPALALIYAFWGALAVLSLVLVALEARQNLMAQRQAPEGPFTASAAAMLSFVRTSTPPDSVIIFYKPRLLRLFTDRDSFFTTHCDDLPRGDYLVLREDTEGGPGYNQIPPDDIADCRSVGLTLVLHKEEMLVYELSPAP